MITDEEKISRLYKQGKEPGPSADLDNIILSAARDAVQDDAVHDRQQANKPATARSPLVSSPFSGGWRVSASIAAVLVITVILVPLLQQEEISPTVSGVADETPVLIKEQDLIRATNVNASDVRKSGAAKENTEAKKTVKNRSKMAVLQQDQASQLPPVPAGTLNANTFSSGKQFSVEEKIAPARMAPEKSERLLSPVQEPQPASAVVGATVYDQEQKASAEIKQQAMGVLDAAKKSSVTMAAKPWMQKIRRLIAQGDLDLARQELDEFKLRYPGEDIDQSIVNLLK